MWGGDMENQEAERSPISAAFGRRKFRPRVCVVDGKPHIRSFLSDALEDLGFITSECERSGELAGVLNAQVPDLIVLGLSAGGVDGVEILKELAAREFGGQVLILGPRFFPMVTAVQVFGEGLGLAMLPILATPFAAGNLRDSVATLLPIEPPPQPPVDVAEAISAGWLELWYQPKVDTRTVSVSGAEALVRMRHPTWGIVTPAYFIPGEDDPRFRALSEFVIDQAIRDWHDFIAEHGPIEIAINLPIAFLQDPDAVRILCLKMPDHPAFEGLIIEINAIEVAENLVLAKAAARQLRFHNIGLSIDGLGADWPQLMDVRDFPFVEIKVDRQFVTGCADDRLKQTVCRGILDLADGYGVRTVAEGVETTTDFLGVREMGFAQAQGFLFAKPLAAKKFARTVLRRSTAMPN
jgi:EAL domain-containing protein (putative c-di-GMP-specific phosphodiesterase class I)